MNHSYSKVSSEDGLASISSSSSSLSPPTTRRRKWRWAVLVVVATLLLTILVLWSTELRPNMLLTKKQSIAKRHFATMWTTAEGNQTTSTNKIQKKKNNNDDKNISTKNTSSSVDKTSSTTTTSTKSSTTTTATPATTTPATTTTKTTTTSTTTTATTIPATTITTVATTTVPPTPPATFTKNETAIPKKEAKLVSAAPDAIPDFHRMDVQCAMERHSFLRGMFCDFYIDQNDEQNCDLDALREFYQTHQQSRALNMTWGCPLDEALCYAKRYPWIIDHLCPDGDIHKCSYHVLRQHYETQSLPLKRIWGCERSSTTETILTEALSIPNVSDYYPLTTVERIAEYSQGRNVFGKATAQTFQGKWVPDERPYPTEPVCPKETAKQDCFCNLTAREGWQPARYVAEGLQEFSMSRFLRSLEKTGGLLLIGDSLMYQLRNEITCRLEAEGIELPKGLIQIEPLKMGTIPARANEHIELRLIEGMKPNMREAFGLQWVHKVIRERIKYVVINTGAWYNPKKFQVRGDWCDYDNWRYPDREETIAMYRAMLRESIFPALKFLKEEYDVTVVWRDTSPAGRLDLETGELMNPIHFEYYWKIFPYLNEIARQMVIEAGGLVLPIWDASIPRWNEHKYGHTSGDDLLHWCHISGMESVPAVWLRLLSHVLFGNETETGVASHNGFPDRSLEVASRGEAETGLASAKVFSNGDTETDVDSDISFSDWAFEVPFIRDNKRLRNRQHRHLRNRHQPNRHRKRLRTRRRRNRRRERLLAQSNSLFSPLSRSAASPCNCNQALEPVQCRANIRCHWDSESLKCLEPRD